MVKDGYSSTTQSGSSPRKTVSPSRSVNAVSDSKHTWKSSGTRSTHSQPNPVSKVIVTSFSRDDVTLNVRVADCSV